MAEWRTGTSLARLAAAGFAALVLSVGARAQVTPQQTLGYFETSADVGNPAIGGSTSYDAAAQTYTIAGSGTNMWAARDEFQFAWRKLKGDFIVRTHARFLGTGTDPHRKLGWIVRSSLDADATYADAAVHGDGLASLQFRASKGGPTFQLPSAVRGARRDSARTKGHDVHHVGRALRRAVHADRADRARAG